MGVAAVLGLRSNEQPSALSLDVVRPANGQIGAITAAVDIIRQGVVWHPSAWHDHERVDATA
jgi:hypothetical protein